MSSNHEDPTASVDDLLVDSILKELLVLQADIGPKIKRINEIKAWCIEAGSFSTLNHVCSVAIRERTGLVSLDKAIEVLGEKLLKEKGLIQTISFQVVSISSKFNI